MTREFDPRTLKRRMPVWAALSDLFLDTDLTLIYDAVGRALRKSRYSPEEIERILFEEVAPVFYTNVLSENPVWSAWSAEQVRDLILDHFELPPFQRHAEQHASADVAEQLFQQHWLALRKAAWGDRPPRARRPFKLSLDLRFPKLSAWQMLKWSPAAFVALLALTASYEALALLRARARTPAILQQAWAQAGPPLSRELPVSWIEALLRVEDPGFRRHRGVDFETPGQGLTTITQALVRRLYFERFTPGFGKIEQSLIARFVLDEAITKDEQLDLFLSFAYFGNVDGQEVIGFRNAAQTYYGRALGELDRREFLALVAMLPAPNELRPGTAESAARVVRIERLLEGECQPTGWRDVWLEACGQ